MRPSFCSSLPVTQFKNATGNAKKTFFFVARKELGFYIFIDSIQVFISLKSKVNTLHLNQFAGVFCCMMLVEIKVSVIVRPYGADSVYPPSTILLLNVTNRAISGKLPLLVYWMRIETISI